MKRILLAFLLALGTTAAFATPNLPPYEGSNIDGWQTIKGPSESVEYITHEPVKDGDVITVKSLVQRVEILEGIAVDYREYTKLIAADMLTLLGKVIEQQHRIDALEKKVTILVNMKRIQHAKGGK